MSFYQRCLSRWLTTTGGGMASVVCPDFASMEISMVRGISASSPVPGTWQYFKENDGNEIGENPVSTATHVFVMFQHFLILVNVEMVGQMCVAAIVVNIVVPARSWSMGTNTNLDSPVLHAALLCGPQRLAAKADDVAGVPSSARRRLRSDGGSSAYVNRRVSAGRSATSK